MGNKITVVTTLIHGTHEHSKKTPMSIMNVSLAFSIQRQFSVILAIWICFTVGCLMVYCVQDQQIFRWGPQDSLHFFDIVINTWSRWATLTFFIFVTQALKVFADEIISPFITNTIMDHKEINIVFSYVESQLICQTYYMFSAINSIIQISIATSQIDFILVLIFTDLFISTYTTHVFLSNKIKFYSLSENTPDKEESQCELLSESSES